MTPVFVDTSGWVALFNPADQYHERAREGWRVLCGHGYRLITSDYVFDETMTFIQARCGLDLAVGAGDALLGSALLEIYPVDPSAFESAWRRFKASPGDRYSFTDVTSFALMDREDIGLAFAFDRDFVRAGFELLAL